MVNQHLTAPADGLFAEDDAQWVAECRRVLDAKTKPVGSLGTVEDVAVAVMRAQKSLTPSVDPARMLLFASDHGLSNEPVSRYPRVVTREMIKNIAAGGAAVSVLCRLHGVSLEVHDLGVDYGEDGVVIPGVHHTRVKPTGSENMLHSPALSPTELDEALEAGRAAARRAIEQDGVKLLCIGELGIGNTAVASVLLAAASGKPVETVVGRGTGVDDEGLKVKREIVEAVLERHRQVVEAKDWRGCFKAMGGLELAAMAGAIQESARLNTPILIDGFICLVSTIYAFLLSSTPFSQRDVSRSILLTHFSAEQGTMTAVEFLKSLTQPFLGKESLPKPLLDLGLRLGEGSGAAMAVPIVRAAVAIVNEMATFESAGVSKDE
ncbi:hypothetical protein HK102_011748 [Quaeritorhiza haematococci]|nr:hypothetical protein HK102_011748 [Quaeritorhiza haematococci]